MRIAVGRSIHPFDDSPQQLPVLDRTLAECQQQVCEELGLELVERNADRTLIIGDHTWFTTAILRRFLETCPPDGGRLAISGPFLEYTRPLQELEPEPCVGMPVYISPTGETTLETLNALPLVEVDLAVRMHEPELDHVVFRGLADEAIPVTDRMIHTVEHWSHLHRVNLLALMAHGEGLRREYEARSWWRKLWFGLQILLSARSLNRFAIASALTRKGRNCNIHPTATVEACQLGDDVEIGPYAVVRASWVASGVKIQEHAQVNLSVLGEDSVVGRGAMVNLCVLMKRAMVSRGFGHQASVFGRDAFVAVGSTLYDLSFGSEIKVSHRNRRVSSGTRFLGSCLGHRALIGPHVRIGYGESIPNDTTLVGDPTKVLRRIPDALEEGVVHTFSGEALTSIERLKTERKNQSDREE